MKINDHLILGLLTGIVVGLNYGGSLVTYMPFFVIGIVVLLFPKIVK